jgi:predicted esterase
LKIETNEHKFSLIWLHGLGGNPYNWIATFTDKRQPWIGLPRGTKIIIPSAPWRRVGLWDGEHMPSWFDIKTWKGTDEMTGPDETWLKENYSQE